LIAEQVEYTYDTFDRRTAKAVDPDGKGRAQTETERFVYDGAHIALVFDGKGKQTHRYLYGPQIDQVLADETVTGAVQWALSDQQGSVRDVINNQGQLLNHIRYDSFGNITSQTNANVDFRFGYTGREFDEETGLYYYRARYYDASIGRFISEDPMGFGAGDSNLYRYVGNSATNFTDPTGNFGIGFYGGIAAGVLIPMTIAGAWFPNPAQTPTNRCDIDPTDNSGKRAVVEIVASLGLGIGTTLARKALSSLADNIGKISLGLSRQSIKNLRFSQSDASPFFNNGKRVDDLVEALRSGKVTPDDLPALQVVQLEGKLFSIDNRRLAAYSLAGVDDITVEIVSLKDPSIAKRFFSRFDPINGEGHQIVIATSKQREMAQQILLENDMIKGIQLGN
jgi:RHS repeat-associated protein